MKKYIAIIIGVVCLLLNTVSFAQRVEGPKAEKKEQKMIKKQNKIEKKKFHGHNNKADKKSARARKKTAKLQAKQERDK